MANNTTIEHYQPGKPFEIGTIMVIMSYACVYE